MPAMKVSGSDFLKTAWRVKRAGGKISNIAADTGLDEKSVSVKLSGLRKKIGKDLVPTFDRGRVSESKEALIAAAQEAMVIEDEDTDNDDS